MRILLDTCTFLWLNLDASELSTASREAFLDARNEFYLSAVSCWEISVKYRCGRLKLPEPPGVFIPKYRSANGIEPLSVDEQAALLEAKLPAIHADPFDRMLICQALAHGMPILTPDPAIHKYPVRSLW